MNIKVFKWISIKDRLPANEKPVLAYYKNSRGNGRTVKAIYVERFSIESNPDFDALDEYCEEDDTYYIRDGWYECVDNWGDWSSIAITNGPVSYWMPMPEPPEGE